MYKEIAVYKNPCFSYQKDGPNGADVAIMKLDSAPPDTIPRIAIYKWRDEVGQNMVIVGWGDTGKAGSEGKDTTNDGKFRVALNKVTKTPSNKGMLFYTLDKNAFPLEGIAWSGDSGGPVFLTKDGIRYIAGVNSAGDCCKYGSEDGYSRLSVKYNWIQETMAKDSAASFNCKTLEDDTSQTMSSTSTPSTGSSLRSASATSAPNATSAPTEGEDTPLDDSGCCTWDGSTCPIQRLDALCNRSRNKCENVCEGTWLVNDS